MDIDTRLLRSFVAVAEEGHLTRAARRLYLSQPALTKQIRQLERLLEVELFVRSRAGMTLTEPGSVLAEQAPALLAGWDRMLRATKGSAARAARVLRVGFVASAANEFTPAIVAAFREREPRWRVDMRQFGWTDPSAGLDAGEVDVALVRLPFPGQDDYRISELFAEPRWIALPAAHRLADCARIEFAQLWDEPFVAAPPDNGRWRDFWIGADERPPETAVIGAIAHNTDEWLTAIANGFGISFTPASSSRYYPRPGIVYRPVDGIGPSRVAVAWPSSSEPNAVVREYIRCCREICVGRGEG
ncbi:LysR family transcriptional regulator [Nocardia sp. CDC159]|uniref:LysR family transcriptional regulator n=1 Tax=Nocardia pulmonis TaxID=2951408 RepID=A0A9X2IUF7_9NOCA|nr:MULTISPECIES: LysR family transcriptional regulator [Nocardia]MCM6772028.1 LysR family transcriptional regulator [Nocardia pulmonis]MCM6785314.1 LysR family transcriptional regulator [Nocardia sp. CDC159]